jgi:hypothetical protein
MVSVLRTRDPMFFSTGSGMEKNPDPDPDPGSGMNIQDRFSESLETVLGLKILNSFMGIRIRDPELFFTLDPGSGMEKLGSGIWDKHPRSATLLSSSKIKLHSYFGPLWIDPNPPTQLNQDLEFCVLSSYLLSFYSGF